MKNRIKISVLAVLMCLVVFAFPTQAKQEKKPQSRLGKYSVSLKGISFSWNKTEGAESYIIYRKEKGREKIQLSSTELLSFTDSSTETGKMYTYTVSAVSGEKKTAVKGKINAGILAVPELISLERTADGLLLKWKESIGARNYGIYRKGAQETKWKRIARISADSLSYEDTDVVDRQEYSYYVRASAGESKSFADGKILTEKVIKAPGNFSLTKKDKKLILKWEKLQDAEKFILFRKVSDGNWKKIKEFKKGETEYTDKIKKQAAFVSYKIKATTLEGESAFSKVVSTRDVDPTKPMVALTYDDGPHEDQTPEILDVLEKHGARATFFVVGNRLSSRKKILKREAELGCEIANHSYSHTVYYGSSKKKAILEEMNKTDKLIEKYSGQKPTLARAPGGSVGKAPIYADKAFIQWSVDTRDWESRSCSKVVASIKNNVRDGSIILMHDLYGSTAEATEIIVPWLIKEGYQLVTVTELMQARGIKLEGGKTYYNGYGK